MADCKELLGMIVEMENLIFWNRDKKSRSYMQICEVNVFRAPEKNLEKYIRQIVDDQLQKRNSYFKN